MAILGILSFVVVRSLQPAQTQALQQAERLRDDLRHMQILAMSWNQALRLNVVVGPPASYFVSCVSGAATAPCNGAAAVLDPGRGGAFQVTLPAELALAGPGFTLDIDTLGRPKNGAALIAANATYTISGGGPARTAVVAPLTGFATAQ